MIAYHEATADKRPQGAKAVASGFISLVTSDTPEQITLRNTDSRLARMRSSVRTAARLHSEAFEGDRNKYRCIMATLTYARAGEWSPKHVSAYVKRARQWAKRRSLTFRFAWVAEIQLGRMKRTGDHVVHYHVLIWLPRGVDMPFADEIGWWPHGMTQTKEVFAPVKYAVKYTSKGTTDAEQFPKGARLHGSGGLDSDGKIERRWWVSPRWAREQVGYICDFVRPVGGGLVVRSTGERLESPWVVVATGSNFVRVARRSEVDASFQSHVARSVQ